MSCERVYWLLPTGSVLLIFLINLLREFTDNRCLCITPFLPKNNWVRAGLIYLGRVCIVLVGLLTLMAIKRFKIIQDHHFQCQSKACMRLAISNNNNDNDDLLYIAAQCWIVLKTLKH